MERKLVFAKCFFCKKNYNRLQLIEMNDNTVEINGDEYKYSDLILDTCFFKIDSENNKVSYTCTECSNSLLSFHFFKRDTNHYNNFQKNISKLEILLKADVFLDGVENLPAIQIVEDSNKFMFTLETDEFIIEDVKEDESGKDFEKELHELIEYDSGDTEEADEEIILKSTTTDSILNQEQIDWIAKEVKSCEVKRGTRTTYKCTTCSLRFYTDSGMAQHLRDTHVLVEGQAVVEEKDELQNELRMSRINTITKTGVVTIWKCKRCRMRHSYKSEEELKAHLKTEHVIECKVLKKTDEGEEELMGSITVSPVQFEISILEEVDQSDAEQHQSKRRKLNHLADLTEEQVNWIRQEVAVSELKVGENKLFSCSICDTVLSTQASLTRHLRDIHVLKIDNDDKRKFQQEVKDSKLVIETTTGIETIWKCHRCENDRIYKSEQAFKLHLRMTHIRATKVDTAFVAACKLTISEADGLRNVWRCPDCKRIFRHRETLRNHIKTEHPDMDEAEARRKMLETPAAMSETNDDTVLRIVKKLEHKQLGKLENSCNECGLKFEMTRHHFKPKVHRDSHETFKILSPQVPHHKCEPCRMIFNTEITLNEHLAVHDTPENIITIPAEGLAQYGANYYKVPTGDADDAVDEIVWLCGHCPVRYFDENDCVTHIMLLHSSPLYCFIDQREFSGSVGMSKYIQHMKNRHRELFPDLTYPCGSCKQDFPSIYEKLSHQKVCASKKFECDRCGKRFGTKHHLQSHILYELGLSGFSCEFCAKRCKTFSDLKIHQNVHSMNRPYDCSVCGKTFKTPAARSSHMETHNHDGIPCEICGQKLQNRTLYKRHKRFQHNEEFRLSQMMKNVCNECGKSFLRTTHFQQHMKKQHGIQQT